MHKSRESLDEQQAAQMENDLIVIKTLEGWEKSPYLTLDEYLAEPCRIDEKLYNLIAEAIVPHYAKEGIIQFGEADFKNEDGVMNYMTISEINGKYFYLGILPEFKNR